MIALIDYGAGNLTSVKKAFAAIGADVRVPGSPRELDAASAIVVPGVGHFGATASLGPEWREAILRGVNSGRPLLGICLGMQWLFEGSSEAPACRGLGLLAGRCERLSGLGGQLKVPHVGWNALAPVRPARLLEGVAPGAYVYFTHSYAAPLTAATATETRHGETFASSVEQGIVMGVQFHPEKSGDTGLQMLRNFLTVVAERG